MRLNFSHGLGLAALCLGLTAWAPLHRMRVRQLAEVVDGRYDSLSSLRAHFVEIYSQGGDQKVESGRLYLKPGRMRWDYRQPRRKLFLVTAHRVWLYVEGEQQAQVTPLKRLADLRSPLRFLLGHTHLERELHGLAYGGLAPLRAEDVVLRGQPQGLGEGIREVLLEISPAYDIRRIVIRQQDGGQTDLRFSRIEANHRLAHGLFHFHPPAGVRVVPGTMP